MKLVEELTQDQLDLMKKYDYQGAYDLCSTLEDAHQVVDEFLKARGSSYYDRLGDAKDIVIKLVEELGFEDADNPYLKFCDNYYRKNQYNLKKDDWIVLNDIYANNIVDFGDIAGTGKLATDHIIYNENLYNSRDSKDAYNTIRLFDETLDDYKMKSLNLDAINEDTVYAGDFDVVDKNDKDYYKKIRDIIFYKQPQNPSNSPIYKYKRINDALTIGETTYKEGDKDSRVRDVQSELKGLKDKDPKVFQQVVANISTQDDINAIRNIVNSSN